MDLLPYFGFAMVSLWAFTVWAAGYIGAGLDNLEKSTYGGKTKLREDYGFFNTGYDTGIGIRNRYAI